MYMIANCQFLIFSANYQETWKCITTIDSEGLSQTQPPNNIGGAGSSTPHPPPHTSGLGSLVSGGFTLGGLTGGSHHYKDRTGWYVYYSLCVLLIQSIYRMNEIGDL